MKNIYDLNREELIHMLNNIQDYINKSRMVGSPTPNSDRSIERTINMTFDYGFEQGVNCTCNGIACVINEDLS
jgi:hypothetical protein